jgi:hypothetical protein
LQRNLSLSFPDVSFSWIQHSSSEALERILFDIGSGIYCFLLPIILSQGIQWKCWLEVSLYRDIHLHEDCKLELREQLFCWNVRVMYLTYLQCLDAVAGYEAPERSHTGPKEATIFGRLRDRNGGILMAWYYCALTFMSAPSPRNNDVSVSSLAWNHALRRCVLGLQCPLHSRSSIVPSYMY